MEQRKPSGISATSPALHPGPAPRLMEPARRGLPPMVPYTYQGTGTGGEWEAGEDLEAAIWQAMRAHAVTTRNPVAFADAILAAVAAHQPLVTIRHATPLDDPALRYPCAPVSAPPAWIRDYEQGEL